MKAHEVYQRVTDNIIREIEAGNLPPWLQPWRRKRRGSIFPRNAATKRSYSGTNVLILWSQWLHCNYDQNLWLTFNQCRALGGNVRKGEKSTTVIFVKKLAIQDNDEEKLIPMMKTFAVFNVGQCDGLVLPDPLPERPEPERNQRVENFFDAVGAQVKWGETMAAYLPSKDLITMPARADFKNAESLYATLAHEHIHYTGHKSRLNRELSVRFKEDSYAFEELIAEIGAAMLCAHLDVTGELRHASYCAHWLKILKQDSRAILTAASMASKAADYLRAFSEELDPSS